LLVPESKLLVPESKILEESGEGIGLEERDVRV
jgi:hypothetical protein